MPKDRFAADLDQWFRAVIRLFSEPRPHSTS
jgi:hypothetical protein